MHGYGCLLNVMGIAGQDEIELAPGHIIRKATLDESATISELLNVVLGGMTPHKTWLWEMSLPDDQGRMAMLPEDEWRYYVLTFAGSNQRLARFGQAADLASVELEMGLQVMYNEHSTRPGYGANPGRLYNFVDELDRTVGKLRFATVTAENAAEIAELADRIDSHDNSVIDVRSLVAELGQLKALPHNSALRFLGYFAMLESLLTHKPDPKDPYDSIIRQVKKKLALVNNRTHRKIDYGPFGATKPETVWARMYSYRSSVAHGDRPDFSGDLNVLGSPQSALDLIKNTVKAVIRFALDEPQLVIDLRDC